MRTLLAAFVVLPLVACGPLFAVVPPGGAPQIAAASGGVTVTALAEQWGTSPSDLADRVTPIAIVVQNNGPTPVAIALADFELFDDENDGGAALNPFYVPIAQNDQLTPEQIDVLSKPRLVQRGFGRGGFGRGIGGRGYGYGGRRYVPAPRRVWGAPRIVVRTGRWGFHPGFQIHGGLRRYYGPRVGYWGGAWVGPTASAMSNGYSAPEVIQYALPEGVLQPGAEVRGFVYFNKLTSDRTRGLRLRYKARDAQTGAAGAPVEIPLIVVRR